MNSVTHRHGKKVSTGGGIPWLSLTSPWLRQQTQFWSTLSIKHHVGDYYVTIRVPIARLLLKTCSIMCWKTMQECYRNVFTCNCSSLPGVSRFKREIYLLLLSNPRQEQLWCSSVLHVPWKVTRGYSVLWTFLKFFIFFSSYPEMNLKRYCSERFHCSSREHYLCRHTRCSFGLHL